MIKINCDFILSTDFVFSKQLYVKDKHSKNIMISIHKKKVIFNWVHPLRLLIFNCNIKDWIEKIFELLLSFAVGCNIYLGSQFRLGDSTGSINERTNLSCDFRFKWPFLHNCAWSFGVCVPYCSVHGDLD